jgi:hypothetical protein
MSLKKKKYTIEFIVILSVFFFVFVNLVFKLVIDLRSESQKKKLERIKQERIKQSFIVNIDDQYNRLLKLYQAAEYDKAIEIIKVFNQYNRSDYKDLPEIKKGIRLFYLKKKLDFIPKIHIDDYLKLSKDIEIEEDDSIEVFIRTPRYGQYFYTTDLPITLEGVALSVKGDFSDNIVWESDVDGRLGTGKLIQVRLSVGIHQITATSTNGETTGQMITQIIVEKEPLFLKKYRQ